MGHGSTANGSGVKAKFALYRETIRTNRLVGRVNFHIVKGAFATIPSPPLRTRYFKEHWSAQFAFFKAFRNLSVRWGIVVEPEPGPEPLPPASSSRPRPENTSGGTHSPHRPDEFRPAIP